VSRQGHEERKERSSHEKEETTIRSQLGKGRRPEGGSLLLGGAILKAPGPLDQGGAIHPSPEDEEANGVERSPFSFPPSSAPAKVVRRSLNCSDVSELSFRGDMSQQSKAVHMATRSRSQTRIRRVAWDPWLA